MKKILYIISLFMLAACDDGDIIQSYSYQQEGIKVAIDANISGIESWPEDYTVTLSGFELQRNDNAIAEYSEISKQIIPSENGNLHITLGGIPQSVNYLEITVLNRIRQRVITLWQKELTADEKNSSDTIRVALGDLNAGMYAYIQREYFNNLCANCHGLSADHAAAGLFLTEGRSHAAMVGVQSAKRADLNIVQPGDTANSVLHRILWGNFPEVKHNHSDKLALDSDKKLIDLWIMNGAGAE
ncbi:MAG: hypothetical protein K6F33_09480 [Bacteroidales bacterium]|nr:hypothetical protein [Bacteroidales bacterium]